MALPLPSSLSPSKVSTFRDCALAFRFSAIDRLAEPSSPATAKGTLVHRALERLFWFHERGERTGAVAHAELAAAWDELRIDEDFTSLGLDDEHERAFLVDAATLVDGYLRLEDPNAIDAVGLELTLEAEVGGLLLRGIIDRLDVTPDGDFVVVDYKTGRVPSAQQEQQRLGGVQFYALLCEQLLGRRPAKVRLLYLREPVSIEADPSEQALRGLRQRTNAIWSAIEKACEAEDFRPKPSALCNWCAFKPLCPAQGGDPALAASWPLPDVKAVAS
ncbi:MAG TPA: PD-(D/E)XK nuclease family protein [Acidimicrobiales bacterium]|nr:PD-(D/E)XK nuclease family protein [Acidimicrobiales bacterium]